MAEKVKRYIEKFGSEVWIMSDHPLAVAQDALDAAAPATTEKLVVQESACDEVAPPASIAQDVGASDENTADTSTADAPPVVEEAPPAIVEPAPPSTAPVAVASPPPVPEKPKRRGFGRR